MNRTLLQTQVVDGIRVSSAVIFYEGDGTIPEYYQYETFIFSTHLSIRLEKQTKRVHNQISTNLINRFSK